MTGKDICNRAAQFKGYKYWYGGKGQVATHALAITLQRANPGTWTAVYMNKALKDVDGTTKVADCSHLVCKAYGISDIGSAQIATKYQVWTKEPRDGMILWRKGHVGIYENGHVHEMRGIDWDYRFDAYNKDSWTKILYDPAVEYENIWAYPAGWNQDGKSKRWWYQSGPTKDEYFANCVKRINGAYYAFDEEGWMIEGTANIITDENGEIIGVKKL